MNSSFRILYVLPQLPYPPDRGGKIVQYYLIREIMKRHKVWVVSLTHQERDREYAEIYRRECPNLTIFPAASRWSIPHIIESFSSIKPYKALRFYNPKMAAWIQKCIQDQIIDVVHCQNFYTASYITCDEPCGKILYKENFESILLERFIENSGHSWFLRRAAKSQLSKTRRYEINVCKKFNQVLMISETDRERFAKYQPKAPLDVLLPGIDLEEFQPGEEPPIAGRVVFTGSMNYFPNVDAVRFFCTKVWPRIRSKIPHAEFYIVGQNPEKAVQEWDGRDNIKVTGRVDDIRDYLKEASVYVVPLRVGGGVRLKILEAMAMGKATVSTSIGVEGLAVQKDENILLADDPDTMAESVIRLLQSENERKKYEKAARLFAVNHGGWEKVAEKLESIYEKAYLQAKATL